MKIYIELHSERDGRPILGNMDGQGIIDWAKQYKRTIYYKSLPERLKQARKFRKDDTLFYKIVTPQGTELEIIK